MTGAGIDRRDRLLWVARDALQVQKANYTDWHRQLVDDTKKKAIYTAKTSRAGSVDFFKRSKRYCRFCVLVPCYCVTFCVLDSRNVRSKFHIGTG